MVAFVDSNVLVYAVTPGALGARAREVMTEPFVLSVQSLNEMTHVLRRKFRLEWGDVDRAIDLVIASAVRIEPIDFDAQRKARKLAERHKLATYDAQIVASALGAGCDILWSQDMHSGLEIEDRLTIRNPFA